MRNYGKKHRGAEAFSTCAFCVGLFAAAISAEAQVWKSGDASDPDAGLPFEVVDVCPDEGDGVEIADGCEQTGEYITVFTGPSRYRGNIYEIAQDALLTEFCMQLNIPNGNAVDMYFNVYESIDDEPGVYTKIKELVLRVTGTGQPVYYCTGEFVDENENPDPIPLLAGKAYYLGCAWGTGAQVSYGRDNRSYPRPFSVGQTLGLTGGTGNPPLADELTLNAATSGAYSLRVCIRQQGVCCVDEACTQEFAEECAGQFTAPGVTCEEALEYWEQGCPLPEGACCFDVGCTDNTNQFACEAAGGTYMGHFTTCEDNCVQGACCFLDGSCIDGATPEHCASLGGTFRGEDSECATVFPRCGNGSCCRTQGCVDDISRTLCTSIRGTWRGEGTNCEDLNPHCIGVCCWDFGCDMLSPEDCEQLPGHKFYGYGKVCSDFPSPCSEEVQYGACCLPDGRCYFTSDFTCELLEGTFTQDEQCSEANCPPQACCYDDGRPCAEMSVFACEQSGGTAMGPGSTCGTVDCADGLEACCFFNLSCAELPRSECLANGGVPLGQGTTCETVHCGDPVACCLENGSCDTLPPFECLDAPGIPRNKGVLCEEAQCELPVPACCFDDGSCADLAEGECFALGGRPQGFGTSCSTHDCTINCALVDRVKAKCKERNGEYTFKATVLSQLPSGTQVVILLDGGSPVTGTINNRGKAKAKWNNVAEGDHTASLEDCPGVRDTATCAP
ncbi:MAG: hypothetical protein FLDDKLPJ_00743 [Phycisphaerae bacterium]|nr:hypothetical protein [Phycisphaerae bacterium]